MEVNLESDRAIPNPHTRTCGAPSQRSLPSKPAGGCTGDHCTRSAQQAFPCPPWTLSAAAMAGDPWSESRLAAGGYCSGTEGRPGAPRARAAPGWSATASVPQPQQHALRSGVPPGTGGLRRPDATLGDRSLTVWRWECRLRHRLRRSKPSRRRPRPSRRPRFHLQTPGGREPPSPPRDPPSRSPLLRESPSHVRAGRLRRLGNRWKPRSTVIHINARSPAEGWPDPCYSHGEDLHFITCR